MNRTLQQIRFCLWVLLGLVFISCSSSQQLAKNGFEPTTANAAEILSSVPNYSTDLQAIKGKGRAIVSEPGNTERVTVLFSSDRSKSLVTVRNGIGIEGGQMLTDGDTLLVYNKLDKFARKLPIRGGDLDRINRLASLNILDMINYSIANSDVEEVRENEKLYLLQLSDGTNIYIDKQSRLIQQVEQPQNSTLPYSKITYSAYAKIEGFKLPRKISIFGADRESKVALQLTGLELNPELGSLTINLPDDIPVYTQ